MGNLSPRPGRTPSSRRKREQRAYALTVVGGTAALVTVVGVLLAIFGVVGGGLPLIAAIVAVVCLVLFRSTVGGR
ncbi:MAG: hypothetical protein QOC95_2443 [Thermoleophilaceae bacterium]|jgi:uncharacterized membrane protein YkgB|nr:hypothetical protein [Thermoleophilaceae bacterium]